MLSSFHTHTELCRHAQGNVEAYILQAIHEHYDIIGMSDHAPVPKYYNDRMKQSELNGYLEEIKICQEKYKDQITIYSGLEIEYFDDLHSYYKELLTKMDYLVLAIHDFLFHGKMVCSYYMNSDDLVEGYFKTLIKGVETGLFRFVAHPDLFAYSFHMTERVKTYTHLLAEKCLKHHVLLEFNANGFRRGSQLIMGEKRLPYPYKPFWDIIKEYQVPVIVNSDCHNPSFLNDAFEQQARKVAKSYGLTIVESIF